MTKPEFIITQAFDGGLRRSTNGGTSYEIFYGLPLSLVDSCLGTDDLFIDRPSIQDSSQGLWDPQVAPVNPWILDEYIPAANLANTATLRATPSFVYFASGNYLWTVTNPLVELNGSPFWTRISLDLIEGTSTQREYFTALAVSGDADHVLYAGTNYGKLFRIAGAHDPIALDPCTQVIRLDTFSNLPQAWISDIAVDPNDPDNVALTFGGYAPNSARVWLSNDGKVGNSTFRDITADLPSELPVYSTAFSPPGSGRALVLGTEQGIYATASDYGDPNASISWSEENNGLGRVPVYDVEFRRYRSVDLGLGNYAYAPDHTLFIATHGRGAFRSQTLVSQAEPVAGYQGFEVSLSPNPVDQVGRLRVELEQAGTLEVRVLDLRGSAHGMPITRKLSAGVHLIELPTSSLPAGMYLVESRVQTAKGSAGKSIRAVVLH